MTVRAIVTDIEGTTSSIRFVHDVLFPYASRELPDFVRDNVGVPEIAALLDDARAEAGEIDAGTERVIEILLGWIAEDRKATPLKTLQGHVWRRGYERGDFTGHMYDDAVDRLRRWSVSGIDLYVYSSGSVGAQKLLFGYSDAGDLRPLFKGYFDTRIGHKKEAESYGHIVAEIGLPAAEILFLSDVAEELDAARAAGMQTCQLVRDDSVAVGSHPIACSFDEVIIDGKGIDAMSELTIYAERDAGTPLLRTNDFDDIRTELGKAGIRFERWQADRELPDDADHDTIIAAYQAEIDRLVAEGGYQTWDVVSMNPDHPDKEAFRRKFLDEHTHSEDEVRFFVRGQGLFTMHIDDRVYSVLCEKDDLISVPANTKHWFDMGPNPYFTAIRLFNNPEGWVALFTGDNIAGRHPRLDN